MAWFSGKDEPDHGYDIGNYCIRPYHVKLYTGIYIYIFFLFIYFFFFFCISDSTLVRIDILSDKLRFLN